ncbi:hypothetical protein BALOs_1348 [Halobacteriovorax sp. BALOs_7]|uniref:hypothetical protein n=1 Tax=unclassified Halobacteriovorax TaxID=2639665 RepID=UPI000EA1CD32|nr:hypothetical protein [Halobacteriovorax sp. BALOs_7]AYF44351.1 hypothetical protein BALOs_1348 [Halobacteriovorax sp. BALOs_7]
MKKLTLTVACFVFFMTSLVTNQTNAQIYNIPGEFSLGIGNMTKYVGKVQKDLDGGRNYFDFNPYLRANYRSDFYWDKKLILEIGLTIPQEGADDAVTVTNLWLQALIEHVISDFRLQAGAGLFFTYTKMDGEVQTLGNGISTQQYNTPSDVQTAVNNILVIGSDYLLNKDIFINGQISAFNIEDGDERAFSYGLSINYTLGNKK